MKEKQMLIQYTKEQIDMIAKYLENIEVKGKNSVFSLTGIYQVLESGNIVEQNEVENNESEDE
jgi:hypothetical protein